MEQRELYVPEYQAGAQAVGPVLPKVDVIGIEALRPEDVLLPRYRVRQSTSKFGDPSQAGMLYNTLSGEFVKELKAVILGVSLGRVMWDPEMKQNAPLCASDNNLAPRADVAEPPAAECASCPMQRWGADGTPPACSLVYTYLVADVEAGDEVYLLSATRSSVSAARSLNAIIKRYGIGRYIMIAAKLEKNDKFQWYELSFMANGILSQDELAQYAGLRAEMQNVVQAGAMTVDTEQTLATEDEAEPAEALPF